MAKYVELGTNYLKAVNDTDLFWLSWDQVAAEAVIYDYLFLFVENDEYKQLLKIIPSRKILYISNDPKVKTELAAFGHFDVTDQYTKAKSAIVFFEQIKAWFYHGQNTGFLIPDATAVAEELDQFVHLGTEKIRCYVDSDNWQVGLSWTGSFKTWMNPTDIFGMFQGENQYRFELFYQSKGVEVKFRTFLIDQNQEFTIQDFLEKKFYLCVEKGMKVQFQYLFKGKGTVEVEKVLVSRDRGPFGIFLPGDSKKKLSNGETIYYYEKPGYKTDKLIVSFTGALNHIPRYEYISLANHGYPMLLFNDFRSRGGAFQLGKNLNSDYEEAIVAIIKATLAKNNLSPQDLIINGYSMGSFPSLYYGTRLGAGTIIASKPMTQLGKLSSDGKVNWKTNGTMGEARYYLMNRVAKEDEALLDQYFWKTFAKYQNKKTHYYIFGLLQDELDYGTLQLLEKRVPKEKLHLEKHSGYHGDRMPEMRTFINRVIRECAK